MGNPITATVHWRGLRVKVKYDFVAGSPETGPSYSSGGEPACPAEVDTHSAYIVDDDDEEIGFVAAGMRQTFDAEVYHQLVEAAEESMEPDPDWERERQ